STSCRRSRPDRVTRRPVVRTRTSFTPWSPSPTTGVGGEGSPLRLEHPCLRAVLEDGVRERADDGSGRVAVPLRDGCAEGVDERLHVPEHPALLGEGEEVRARQE